jgi:pyrroloquinoline quinone (PQQ) biosynthesis protein C
MNEGTLLSSGAFKQKLLDVGHDRYHHKHPFHLLMHEGS